MLVSVGTGNPCFLKDPWTFSPQRIAGAEGGECVGIGYWKPGLRSVEIIEPIGHNPQSISPATADLLRNWSVRSAEPLRN